MRGSIVADIRAGIRERASTEGVKKMRRFFREPLDGYGLTTAQIEDVVKQVYPAVKGNLPLAIEVVGSSWSPGCWRRPPWASGY